MVSYIMNVLFVFLLISALYSLFTENKQKIEDVAISDLASRIKSGEVTEVTVAGSTVTFIDTNGTEYKTKKELESSLSETLSIYGVTPENLDTVKLAIKNESGFGYILLNILPIALPIIFILLIFWFLSRQVKGAGMQAFSFGQSKAKITNPNDKKNKVTFADVAGCKEAKLELAEIVDFLRNPKKFLDIGAQIPKGVLLTGEPGTGKTLLARAVAGEAGVPFFHLSGSEFVEMFVGVGASRVRDLFQMAKKASPSIVFVDEIDAVGRIRGTGIGGGNDEREQTLNQILVEMDGFEPTEKVIVMAATNRSDVLDPALLRPGRFDRRVLLELPDRSDREEILRIHARKKPFDQDINLKVIAERTSGFSGADLYSLMNEAAILAAREDRKKIAQNDLIRSIEKVMLGPERKSHVMSKKEKKIVAYHEGGHALVASLLPDADPVHKVSIVSRGHAGGYTLKIPTEDRRLQSRKEFLDDITMTLGGYAAEEIVFGDVTTGPSNDLQVATNMARAMVSRWGMSSDIGPVAFAGDGGRFPDRDVSEEISAKIDNEVRKILSEAMKKAKEVLTENRKLLDTLADKLIEVETLEQKEYEELLVQNGVNIKQRFKDEKEN
ncbi:ATP-dependent zinc metalloprotease FtsH [Candidatus Nomurabacteria bacterium]|nr:ATP-dependent zinc metalloprotease FtsH [Candidatus Nomurabacteria bacterium]USN95134.1 MAG: ATP-dependent zinc metalloprotease FtsH [Candidatus Nomurabacteria bacterium]